MRILAEVPSVMRLESSLLTLVGTLKTPLVCILFTECFK